MTRRLLLPEPVLTPDELDRLGRLILGMTTADTVALAVEHTARGVTRVHANRIRTNNDGSTIALTLTTQFGRKGSATFACNRIDEESLKAAVTYVERVAREQPGDPNAVHMPLPRLPIPQATAWHLRTVEAFATARHAVLPTVIDAVADAKLVSSSFVGVAARSILYQTKDGVHVSGQETDAELVVTAWTPDGTGVGWSGQAARDWAAMDPMAVAARAIELAARGATPVAIEPGRRTVILGPAAVAQFARAMAYAWDADATINGLTPFFDTAAGTKLGKRVMDERVTITCDPNDSEGGYLPFYTAGADGGSALVPMTWLERGVLTNLAFNPRSAASRGVHLANDVPFSMRLGQGTSSLEGMIAACPEGLYVNRVANVEVLSPRSGLMSGVTQGGCFLVKDGKLTKPVKNLRFVDSPFIFLNNLIEIGTPHRAALGYTPGADAWPLPPEIVPPLMVRDFNFTMLADAV